MSTSNISGNVALGYSEVSDQQPGALGEEFTVVSAEYDKKHDVYVNSNASTVRVKLLKNLSGATLSPGKVVKRYASGNMSYEVTVCGADEPGCAIVDPTLASAVPVGGKFLGVIEGETDVLVGGTNISKGATLKSGAAGVVVTNHTTAKTVGRDVHSYEPAVEFKCSDVNCVIKNPSKASSALIGCEWRIIFIDGQ